MPVGTKATIKGVPPWLVAQTGAQCVLANTYHLLLRPGPDIVRGRGGLHGFMLWDAPILTDSGGYQAFSMSDTNRITDDAVIFKSIVDGSTVALTPERAIEVQNALGADIIMALDDCPPSVDPSASGGDRGRPGAHARRLDEALDRTARWLARCAEAHARPGEQALFGIVQGGTDLERRSASARQVTAVALPGYAIGGVAVGEGHGEIARVVAHTAPLLPDAKPRYLMGVGYERDLVAAVRAGVDMFDCVIPTRNGRNANAFTRNGRVRLRNAGHAEDDGPIEEGCDCPACAPAAYCGAGWAPPGGRGWFSRSYLRHLFMAEEMLGPILVTLHNLRHFQRLMVDIRATIREDGWLGFSRRWPVADPAWRGDDADSVPG